jgi:hypothetical protein
VLRRFLLARSAMIAPNSRAHRDAHSLSGRAWGSRLSVMGA